ncbi:ferric reductase like transmembrane component domain-containing protein [Trichoderma chlorosporum]
MRLFTKGFLYLSLLVHISEAQAASPKGSPELCVKSCENSLKSVRFIDVDPTTSNLWQACQSRLALSSIYLCLDLNCGAETRNSALQHHNSTCYDSFGDLIPSFKTDFTDEETAALRRVTKNDSFDVGNPLDEVVIPSLDWFSAWFDTLDAVEYARSHHYLYGIGVMIFWAVVVFLGVAYKIYLTISQLFCSRNSFDSAKTWPDTGSWFKRNIAIPATFGYRCAQNAWWATIPPRIQTLTITLFLLMNIAFCIHGYKIIEENLYFVTPTKQVLRYVSDRTGIISFANFPFIWLFGMRNNVALWLTGWDFGTYNNFHRWCARISTIEAVVHSVLYTVLIFMNGGWSYYAWWFTMWFWNAGQIATILMCVLLPLSVYWIRRRFYEAFLIIHIVLSFVILVTMLGHVSIFNGEYDALFWIPAFIWVFDRVIRLLRIVIYNPGHWSTTALASYSSSANIIRLTIPTDNALYKIQPGKYFYLTVLDDKRFWESHPFTVASTSGELSQLSENSDEEEPLLTIATAHPEIELGRITTERKKQYMTFLMRPYDGFTRRLRDLLTNEEPSPRPLRVLVDGPYGHTRRLHHYQHAVFIAGGSGIVVALSYLNSLCNKMRARTILEIHWAVREPAFVRDIVTQEAQKALVTGKLSLHLYMSSQMDDFSMTNLPSQVKQHADRLNIHSVVMSAARGAQGNNLAVVACGPARMADDARLAVVDALKQGNHHIDYYEESFTW